MSHSARRIGAGALAMVLTTGAAHADVLYGFSTNRGSDVPSAGYYPEYVSVTTAANVDGPADGSEIAAGNVGLFQLRNHGPFGFILTSSNGTAIDNDTKFGTGYLQFTVSAEDGYALDLTSLDFLSARSGSAGTRGFTLFAATDGEPFVRTTDQIYDVNDESGTRDTPRPLSVDLTDARFQGISSVTFRYYPATNSTGNAIEFNQLTVNGTVSVPEPASIVLGAGGALSMLARRRR